jgi:hypothetical protein
MTVVLMICFDGSKSLKTEQVARQPAIFFFLQHSSIFLSTETVFPVKTTLHQ